VESEVPKKEKPERPEDHQTVAAIEKQSEAIRDVAAHIESLANQISADNKTNELAAERRQAAQTCLERRFLRWQQIGVVTSGLLAAFTLIVLAVTLVKTSDLATNAGKQSTIMATQATISENQLGLGQITERAYVSVRPLWSKSLAPNTGPTIRLLVDNKGLTPASGLIVKGYGGIAPVQVSFSDLQNAEKRITPFPDRPFTLLPNIPNMTTDETIGAMSAADQSAVQVGTRSIFVWGRAVYTDANGKSRYSDYCYFFGGKNLETDTFQTCSFNNDAN
jgi:hypothetical protein